jgi:phage terminase large subunit-like protein
MWLAWPLEPTSRVAPHLTVSSQEGPVLERCLGNVVGKADRKGNLYSTKQRPDQKIDAALP